MSAAAPPVEWRKMMTIAEVKRDEQSKILPLQSHDETIRRGMSFLLDDHLKWFKGPAESLVDEKGQTQMPWVYYSNLQHDGTPFANAPDRFVSYPAFHHALMIRTFIGSGRYAGDKRPLAEAVKLTDWEIAHSTPTDWPSGNLPWSTYQEKKPGGFRDKTGLKRPTRLRDSRRARNGRALRMPVGSISLDPVAGDRGHGFSRQISKGSFDFGQRRFHDSESQRIFSNNFLLHASHITVLHENFI